MRPSLAYLSRRNGRLLEVRTLADEWRQLSIRHLAVDGVGQVWAGCQYASPDGRRLALVLRHGRGGDLRSLACPPVQLRAMCNYVGSVTANARGTVVATSSPLGGRVLFWDAAGENVLDAVALPDVCGVAPHGDEGFVLSSGHGVLAWHRRAGGRRHAARHVLAWDNHMRRVPG